MQAAGHIFALGMAGPGVQSYRPLFLHEPKLTIESRRRWAFALRRLQRGVASLANGRRAS